MSFLWAKHHILTVSEAIFLSDKWLGAFSKVSSNWLESTSSFTMGLNTLRTPVLQTLSSLVWLLARSTRLLLFLVSMPLINGEGARYSYGEVSQTISPHARLWINITIAIGMTVSQLLVAVLGTTTTGQDADGSVFSKNLAAQKASIAFVCIYIFFFASTWVCYPLGIPLSFTH